MKKLGHFKGALSGLTTDGKQFYFIGAANNGLCSIYQFTNKKFTVVEDLNREYLKEHYVAKAEALSFKNSEGDTVEGWVLKPKDYKKGKKYPAVLEIHGGPRCAYGTIFFHEMQVYASMGYFVFFCNPHGSDGYGEAFADLRGRYGEIDYQDLMQFTDLVLKKYPDIHPKKVCATGGSYGGFMCNWIEGHTDRFVAIASQRSVSNWVADFGASEIGITFDTNEIGATPWSDMEKMWNQSPLKYANKAKTPILFIHSLMDYNCPFDQGLEMFSAMKYFHVPSKMVLFEKENHNLSRNGKPKHRIRRLEEMQKWFDEYTKKGGNKK